MIIQGEVNVAQEELNSFLAVAEELKVKGIFFVPLLTLVLAKLYCWIFS
jgi:hypothetical protein